MDKQQKKDDKSTWAIGGCLMIGIGVGLFLMKQNPIALPACVMVGLGVGLVITSIMSKKTD